MAVELVAKLGVDHNCTADLLGTSRCTTFMDRINTRSHGDPSNGKLRQSLVAFFLSHISMRFRKAIWVPHSPIYTVSNVGTDGVRCSRTPNIQRATGSTGRVQKKLTEIVDGA